MTTIKRLNLSLLGNSEVSMFKSLCKFQGIKLPDNYDEAFNVDDIIDFPHVVFDDLGEVKVLEEPDEDFVWLNGLEGFMYLFEQFQDQKSIIEDLKNVGTFENLYIKLLEEADADFDYDEPESWGEPEEDEDEESECRCPQCLEYAENNIAIELPLKGAFIKQGHLQLVVKALESFGFKPKRPVKDTDLFLVVYEDRTFETLDSSRAYLELDIPELERATTVDEDEDLDGIIVFEI